VEALTPVQLEPLSHALPGHVLCGYNHIEACASIPSQGHYRAYATPAVQGRSRYCTFLLHKIKMFLLTRFAQPLHVAIKTNRVDVVELLLQAGASQFLTRDASGSTPLHIAVANNYVKITKMLVAAGPAEALALEDAVGNTPLETATRQAFLAKLDVVCGNFNAPHDLALNYNQQPFDVEKQEKELALLRTTINDLLREGRLTNGTKLMKELVAFADHLETKLTKEKAAADEKKKTEEDSKIKASEGVSTVVRDSGTPSEVLKVLSDGLAVRPSLRHLVHLSDVHESVNKSLDVYNKRQKEKAKEAQGGTKNDDGLPEEEEVATSALASWYCTTYKSYRQQSCKY
jgi:hypothetical protein